MYKILDKVAFGIIEGIRLIRHTQFLSHLEYTEYITLATHTCVNNTNAVNFTVYTGGKL